jgi:hypothetical protein
MYLFARVLAVVVIASAVAAAAPPAKVNISSHTKTVEVRDNAWGITAFRMEIPDNWTFEGVLLRDAACGGAPTIAYRVSSPDGLAGFQSLPTFIWHSSDDPSNVKSYRQFHCKVMDAMTPAEFLTYLAPAIRPNPTIGTIGPTVDAAQLDAMIAQYNGNSRSAPIPSEESGGGVRSRLEYTFHGQVVEENLRVVVQTFKTQVGAYNGPKHTAWSSSANVTGLRAPKGQLDSVMKQVAPMFSKAAFTPEWINRQQRKMAADQASAMDMIRKQGAETSAMLKRNHDAYMKQSRESFEHSQQIDRDRQDAMHRGAVAWTLYAGDEQLVRNPSTGEVSRVTNQHGTNAHQDSTSGDIVVSDDPNFDPAYYIRGTWTQLENVDPMKP